MMAPRGTDLARNMRKALSSLMAVRRTAGQCCVRGGSARRSAPEDDVDDVRHRMCASQHLALSGPHRPSPVGAHPIRAVVLAAAWLAVQAAFAGGLVGSPHDFSRATKSASGPSPCEFCHVPQRVAVDLALPLWGHRGGHPGFPVYGARPGISTDAAAGSSESMGPGASTRLCMSCHDGTSASLILAATDRMPARHHAVYGQRALHGAGAGESVPFARHGNALINGHPVFVPYPKQPHEFNLHVPPSPSGWADVKLVDGRVECVSCHDVHATTFRPFLRRSNAGSAICLTCHKK